MEDTLEGPSIDELVDHINAKPLEQKQKNKKTCGGDRPPNAAAGGKKQGKTDAGKGSKLENTVTGINNAGSLFLQPD
jgi:hypothetical protein